MTGAIVVVPRKSKAYVLRHGQGTGILEMYGTGGSNYVSTGCLAQLGYTHRRSHERIPPTNDQKKARIRHFLVEIDVTRALEKNEEAVLVYVDKGVALDDVRSSGPSLRVLRLP